MHMVPRDLVICPTCHVADFTSLDPDPPFPAVRCRQCGLGIELSLTADPYNVYSRETYDRVRDKGSAIWSWRRWHHDLAVAAARYGQVHQHLAVGEGSPGHWTDVGCNTGALPAFLRRFNWDVLGVEVDMSYQKEVSHLIGIDVSLFAEWMRFDSGYRGPGLSVVSFFDVLEHIHDPPGALLRARNVDRIIVEVPDLDAAAVGVDGFRVWKHRRITSDVTEHVWHFNEVSLSRMLETYVAGKCLAVARPCPGRLQIVWAPSRESRVRLYQGVNRVPEANNHTSGYTALPHQDTRRAG